MLSDSNLKSTQASPCKTKVCLAVEKQGCDLASSLSLFLTSFLLVQRDDVQFPGPALDENMDTLALRSIRKRWRKGTMSS